MKSQPFQDLDPDYHPEARPVTALGRVLVGGLVAAGFWPAAKRSLDDARERYWCNRPGQLEGENFTIAIAVTLAVLGLSAGWLLEWLSPFTPLDAAWLLVAIVPLFFLVLHLLIFAASGIEALARLLGVAPDQPPGHFPGRLFLLLLTATATVQLFRGPAAGWLTLLVAGAWCLLAALDFLALLLLVFQEFRAALANH